MDLLFLILFIYILYLSSSIIIKVNSPHSVRLYGFSFFLETEHNMVKVWYEPPPYGPRTSLNRPAYGNGGDIGPKWVVRLSKMAPGKVIAGFVAGFVGLAYIPLSKFYELHN
jgi:hypothetical protein